MLILWICLAGIGIAYSTQQHIPRDITIWFIAAALVEVAFYLMPGFPATRTAMDRIRPPVFRALLFAISAVLPYLIYALGTHTFHWRWFAVLATLASVAASWFVLQGKAVFIIDLLFLIFMGAVYMAKVFPEIYITLAPRAKADILGHLMWIRLGIVCVLSLRKMGGIGFGFLPAAKDWRIGIQQYFFLLPVAVGAGILLGFTSPHLANPVWWKDVVLAVGTFIGILWVVALGEEFFFRGMLQQLLAKRFRSGALGLACTSVAFGLVHLPFGQFPNWRFAILAAIAGVFYGIAYMRAKSTRASMVTHALVVTTWRVFFA